MYMPKESSKSGLRGLAQLAFDVLENTVLAPVKVLWTDPLQILQPLLLHRRFPPQRIQVDLKGNRND